MADLDRLFHFLIEGRKQRHFFWNVVFVGRSVAEARSRAVAFFVSEGLQLVEFDEEETGEVLRESLRPEWLKNARPEFFLAAAGGRIWVGPAAG